MTLRQIIEQEIRERGPIPFSRYMELCLYHPELGYYSHNVERFGKAGDFYTSSDVHAVFGRLLARQFEEIWHVLGSPRQIEILELGPGRGLFAQDVLDWSEKKFPEFFHALHYSLSERSPALQERLSATLGRFLASGTASLENVDCLDPRRLKPSSFDLPSGTAKAVPSRPVPSRPVPSGPVPSGAVPSRPVPSRAVPSRAVLSPVATTVATFPGATLPGASPAATLHAVTPPGVATTPDVVTERSREGTTSVVPVGARVERALAPEVPLIIFANEFFDALPVEILSSKGALRISLEDDRITETWVPPAAEELEFLDRYGVQPEPGERIEVPLLAHRCMACLAALVRTGVVITVDYGYTHQEQLAGRHRGTLMAYRQHSATPDPYQAPGEQDLTAHVNFTSLAAAAGENGLQAQPLLTQSQFLMGIGEKNQFADAFEDCRLPQERAKVALQLKHLVTPAGMGESFHVLVAAKGVDPEQVAGLSGLSFTKSRL